ncbi:PadR family transcriptional regulator [Parasphingopyxis sp.]|uniref:PadR family transcriptional regulator n=1 Tax=Parasphingopyxis sp. TaxID=1920299 RepID=UPI003F9ED906
MTAQETPQTLTDHEGSLLSLVHRLQPITAYKVAKFYQESPVASVNKSMGQVYPMINRFSKEGLIEGRPVEDDARGTEVWRTTDKGEVALKAWLREFKPAQLIPHDTLGTKVLSFGLLTHQERIDWVLEAKAELEKKQAELEDYNEKSDQPFQAYAHDNATGILRARMDWLDRVLFDLVKSSAGS